MLPALSQAAFIPYTNTHIDLSDTLIRADGTSTIRSLSAPPFPNAPFTFARLDHGGLTASQEGIAPEQSGFDAVDGQTDIRRGTVSNNFSTSGFVRLTTDYFANGFSRTIGSPTSSVTSDILVNFVVNGISLLNRQIHFDFTPAGIREPGGQGALNLIDQAFLLAPGSTGSLLVAFTNTRVAQPGGRTDDFGEFQSLTFGLQQVPEVSTLATFLPGLLLLMFFRCRHIKDAIQL